MPSWLLVLLFVLGTYRVTRLTVKDDFPPIKAVRDWITEHGPTTLGELFACHWCASGWVSMALVAGTDLATSVPVPVLMWLAAWAGGAWLAHHERAVAGVAGVSARLLIDSPKVASAAAGYAAESRRQAALAELLAEWGRLELVNRALDGLTGEKRNAVLAASAEWRGRRYDPGEPVVPPG